MIQIHRVELGEIGQPLKVVEGHPTLPESYEPAFAKLPQDAVHVYGAQTQCVGKMVLGQWTIITFPAPDPNQRQPRAQLE